MDKLLDVMLKDDLLKSFATLLRAVHLDPRDSEDSSVVSMATLALFGVVISFAKLLYGGSGFSLLAHVSASVASVIILYVIIGMVLLFFKVRLPVISGFVSALMLCVAASCILFIFSFVFFRDFHLVVDGVSSFFASIYGGQLKEPQWLLEHTSVICDAILAIFFAFSGCLLVMAPHGRGVRVFGQPIQHNLASKIFFFFLYFVFSTSIIYALVLDRSDFFVNTMDYVGKLIKS